MKIPKDNDSRPRGYGFVTYKHDESVAYAVELYRGVSLFNRELLINRKLRVPEPPIQQQDMFMQIQNGSGTVGYNMLSAYPPPYASHDQHYRGPMNMYPSNDRRNSSRKHPYYRN